MNRRLHRSRKNNVVSGVCGGFAEYFNIDTVIVRILWICLTLGSFGAGIIIYVISAILMPEDMGQYSNDAGHTGTGSSNYSNNTNSNYTDNKEYAGSDFNAQQAQWSETQKSADSSKKRLIFGGILVILGAFMFIKIVFPWIQFKFLWPLIIIGAGILLLYRGKIEH